MRALRTICAALLIGWAAAPAAAQAEAPCDGSTEANRQIVLALYTEGLVGRKPRPAFERYMSADFVEHKPDVPGGTRAATIAFLEQLIRDVPDGRWTVLRTIAEGDMVFLHARFTPAEGAPAYAIADIFRLSGCKIVEHWDVVAPPPKEQRNPRERF